jgi:simple sugar transport system permease protein
MDIMPKWVDIIVVPLISLFLAAFLSALLIIATGAYRMSAVNLMSEGTLFRSAGWGYMLYYTTNFIFTGLAVSVAFHAALFNIGGEGQAMIGGLGVALVCLFIPWPHWTLAILGASIAAALLCLIWAGLPAYLQAKRGSHIVITTIMFNFIASSLMVYLLVDVLKPKGSMDPASANFPASTHLPTFQDIASLFGFEKAFRSAPANVSFFIAILQEQI